MMINAFRMILNSISYWLLVVGYFSFWPMREVLLEPVPIDGPIALRPPKITNNQCFSDDSEQHFLLVIGCWLFLILAYARGFTSSGPDRCTEDAGKFTIFLDEGVDQRRWSHVSFQNDEKPDAGFIELFGGNSEFMHEVGTTLRCPRFAVVRK